MNKQSFAKYEARSDIIKALAHPTRLFLVDQLAKKEHCVCELTEMVGADTSTVSKHLSILKSAGIVSDDKRGLMVFYRLKAPCTLNFLNCIEKLLQARAKEQMAFAV
ncbi:MAG: transcriptional regulator [Elusimicrobia bacterium RIFOXYB2_FULL_49_7]|nr:MAG: transcriptional regulator [Elusimicrobia bacterium RIFOXYB2_FULL_49_7]